MIPYAKHEKSCENASPIILTWRPGDKHFHTIPQIILAGGRHYLKAISHMGDDGLVSAFINIYH